MKSAMITSIASVGWRRAKSAIALRRSDVEPEAPGRLVAVHRGSRRRTCNTNGSTLGHFVLQLVEQVEIAIRIKKMKKRMAVTPHAAEVTLVLGLECGELQ